VLQNPRHPYTQVLLSSVPDPSVHSKRTRIPTRGETPTLLERASNCPFHTRCAHAREICRTHAPPDVEVRQGQNVRCHLVASGEL
jgi:oligopeptide/dipeptide ABC transporter ATP-binding protein